MLSGLLHYIDNPSDPVGVLLTNVEPIMLPIWLYLSTEPENEEVIYY